MIIHIVEQGETIWSIANEYGVSTERIIADNGLFGLESLVNGQALLILQPDTVYTVNDGDTIYSISSNFGISANQLKQRNPSIAQSGTVTPGETIAIDFKDQDTAPINIYGFLYPNIKNNVLKSALPTLGSGAIFSYGSSSEGNLIEINDSNIINTIISANSSPMMVLSSITEEGSFDSNLASDLFNNTQTQNIVISNILNTMRQKGYSGLDIDFEFVNAEDKDAYVNFVRNVTQQLNSNGFSVNVDLAPKTSATQSGTLYEGHDYRLLGEAANTVLVMTYEWGYTYSEPMAVAPINQVRRVIEYAVSEIPGEKIYMGIPNYGYDWKLPYEKGVTRARLIGNEEAVSIASENRATILFDEKTQTPYFKYRAGDGSDHEVWFEDIRSIKAKFDLIDEFKLKGAGYWNLMRSFSQNWAYIGYRYNPIKPGTPILTI
ncbi:MAG: LysM peptidoglycan-binding domain-containing protein [Clostridia bacterium]|nr:LysM peptidoglycan-binding domain-containing protein [Clostridia bacterium]